MRLVYLGSPSFAVVPLEALVHAGYKIVAVITQPDRPAGRQRTMTPPPVKTAAQHFNLPVFQPPTLRDPTVIQQMRAFQPDVGIVAAYGEILRKDVLTIPSLGYLNIHPSLLPLYRGPTPVASAILAGDVQTGITIMKLDSGVDSGPIVSQMTVPLPFDAYAGTMTETLFRHGAELLLEILPKYLTDQCVLQPQDHRYATKTKLLKKTDGSIDWSWSAQAIERLIRAYYPWPTAFTTWRERQLTIIQAVVHPDWSGSAPHGTLVDTVPGPLVATGAGALELIEIQPAGKRSMSAQQWLLGQRDALGYRFGTEPAL